MVSPLWILKVLLATFFVALGLTKILYHKQNKNAIWWNWAEDFSPIQIKLIGFVEILCSIGIIVPGLVGAAYSITCISAAGIALIMGGACFTHLRRHEYEMLMVSLVFAFFALLVSFLSTPIGANSTFPMTWLGK